jgi:site-specific recombinase XerD
MFDDLFKQGHVRAWHEGTLFAPYLDGYVEELAAQGFEPARLRDKLAAVSWFADHLRRVGVQAIADITPEHVARFVATKCAGRASSRFAQRRKAVNDLLAHLERRGVWAAPPKEEPAGPVQDFYRSLAEERGLQPGSVENYRHYVTRFLRHVGCDGTRESLARLAAKDVDRFIVDVGRTYGRKSMAHFCASIRGLLRYLYRAGILASDLSLGVLAPRYYALERLPCALPWETVKRIFAAVDTTTPRGRRDRAMLWLLVAYGLRAGEVEKLRLDDIDWRRDLLHVRRSKPGRPLKLPLTREVGEAVLSYLRDGRPKSGHREIFLRVNAPYTPLRDRIGRGVVTHYMRKAGIDSHRGGAYVIRHSFAVHLLRQGKPLKTITDLLGHRSPATAYHYTKLAIEDLHDVALPATEVMP